MSWDAAFSTYGGSSGFDGDATSDLIMGNIAYTRPLSDKASGLFVSNVASHTKTSPTAQIGLGIQHKVTQRATIGLDGTFVYAGGFEAGDTRRGNLGVMSINTYKIDNVWRGSLGAALKIEF